MSIQDVYQPVTPLGALAAAALVPVLGFISGKLYDGIKTIFPWYDRLPSWIHQVAAPIWGLIFGFAAAQGGAEALTDIHGISPGFFGALLNTLMMAGIKRWEKAKQPVDATMALENTRRGSSKVDRVRRAMATPRSVRSNPGGDLHTRHPDSEG